MRTRPQQYSGLCQKQQLRVRLVMASGRHARLHLFVPFLVLMESNERADSAPPTRDPHLSLSVV
jgi:hypothetical protein